MGWNLGDIIKNTQHNTHEKCKSCMTKSIVLIMKYMPKYTLLHDAHAFNQSNNPHKMV